MSGMQGISRFAIWARCDPPIPMESQTADLTGSHVVGRLCGCNGSAHCCHRDLKEDRAARLADQPERDRVLAPPVDSVFLEGYAVRSVSMTWPFGSRCRRVDGHLENHAS